MNITLDDSKTQLFILPDVWIRLIKHDYTRGNRLEAKQVYQRAITFLSPQLINILDKAFENIKAEIKYNQSHSLFLFFFLIFLFNVLEPKNVLIRV